MASRSLGVLLRRIDRRLTLGTRAVQRGKLQAQDGVRDEPDRRWREYILRVTARLESSSSSNAADMKSAALGALRNYAGLLDAVHENKRLIDENNNPTGAHDADSEYGRAKSVARKLGLKMPDEE